MLSAVLVVSKDSIFTWAVENGMVLKPGADGVHCSGTIWPITTVSGAEKLFFRIRLNRREGRSKRPLVVSRDLYLRDSSPRSPNMFSDIDSNCDEVVDV